MEYTAKPGECLCQIAIDNGFPDCRKLRDANPALVDSAVLKGGETVTIPEKTEDLFDRAAEALYKFLRPNYPPPRIEFIFEEGKGYGLNTNPKEYKPDEDRKLDRLAVTNYVSDRAGDGATAGDFPADNYYEYDADGSRAPDHFKVQVYDNGAQGDEVKANLYALEPYYIRKDVGGKMKVVLEDDKYERPSAATRKLENIVCKRISDTSYFRSPYLRLVSTEASRAKRPTQCLLMGSYYDEAAETYKKRYSEVLHQKIEAEYKLPKCPVSKCIASKTDDMDADLSLHMAFWIVKGTGVTAAQVRENVYKWIRPAMAPAHIRPIIEHIEEVDIPKNMICLANFTAAGRGRHASGVQNSAGDKSVFSITIDGTRISYYPKQGDSPEQSADGVIALIAKTAALSGYTCKKFEHKRPDVTATANEVSNPFDVLVFKADGKLAEIGPTTYNDRPNTATGKGGQSCTRVMNFAINNFPLEWQPASAEQRILRWNFDKPNCINMYILGTPLVSGGSNYDGWAPYGPHGGWVADVGPCCYLAKTGVARDFVIAHEIGHPVMHVCHTTAVVNDAGGPQTVELMDGRILTADKSDATKHMSDKPIVSRYYLVEESAYHVIDGTTSTGPPNNTVTTPTLRIKDVGSSYGIVRNGEEPVLDSDINEGDVPTS